MQAYSELVDRKLKGLNPPQSPQRGENTQGTALRLKMYLILNFEF